MLFSYHSLIRLYQLTTSLLSFVFLGVRVSFWFAFTVYEYLIAAQAAFKRWEETRHFASYEAESRESRLLMGYHGDSLEETWLMMK